MTHFDKGLDRIIAERGKRSEPQDLELAKRMKSIRKLRGQTLKTAAAAIGISFQQLNKYELGENKIPAPRLKQLADAYGIDINTFFETTQEPPLESFAAWDFSAQAFQLAEAFEKIGNVEIRRAVYQLVLSAAARRNGGPGHV